MRRAAIIGAGMTDVRVFKDSTPTEIGVLAICDAVKDAGIEKAEIEAVVTTPVGYVYESQKFVVQRMVEYLGIPTRTMTEVDCGGASSLVGLHYLADEIALGRIETGLVYSSHWEWTTGQMLGRYANEPHMIRMAGSWFGSYDSRFGVISPLAYYAMCIQRYMRQYNVTEEQIAHLPVLLRENASRNPRAMFQDPITVEDVLSSRMLSPPIHLLESCPMSHGAAALVITSEERAGKICEKPVVLTGFGEAHDDAHFLPCKGDLSRFPVVEKSAREAYGSSGIEPHQVDVAEVYGAFAGVELMCYEEMGFFERGKAPWAVAEGRTRIGGDVAINTSGGRLSLGHAAYATPLFETFEVVTQLRGEAGDRQVPGAKIGLVQAEHGMINGSVVYVMEAG